MKKLLSIIIIILFTSSCSFHTAISYRLDKDEEYIKEEGFMISCKKDHFSYGDFLIIGTYTPETWGEGFYYDYLEGITSNKKIKILSVKLKFIQTQDTLTLHEIRKGRDYFFTSSDLNNLIDLNKQLLVKITIQEELSKTIEKEYRLTRYKNTYSTGTLPHG